MDMTNIMFHCFNREIWIDNILNRFGYTVLTCKRYHELSKGDIMKQKKYVEIVDWVCNHATFIIVINSDGSEEAIKLNQDSKTPKEILIEKIESDKDDS